MMIVLGNLPMAVAQNVGSILKNCQNQSMVMKMTRTNCLIDSNKDLRRNGMYTLEEIERTEITVTAIMIPMKERRYTDENGHLVIEYYDD